MAKKISQKQFKADDIRMMLEELYPKTPIPLNHKDIYTLLIAVLLSAQCTDERVNQITPILFSKADNPQDMIKLGEDAIREIIRPCGLSPMKAKGIYGLSKIIIDKYQGQVPFGFEALESLPGVGHKTASVVMSQGFGVPAFPVDTHIHRLAARWGLSSGKSVEQTEKDLKKLFPESTWNKLHLQIIFYGREYCKARPHVIELCPICKKYMSKKAILLEKKPKSAVKSRS
ncbi:MAG: endonuclease III [Bacteroidetes bacterium]|jgi:endonuclease-3|nr:endonuclease III [Bacteroidota bacterium]MCB0605195.1 endonuclease III [Saprospiraceae bacterium]